tara:strand:+ start:6179 stop:6670 length:492 start_codon:yes stop_codon:yes gene_type:complete
MSRDRELDKKFFTKCLTQGLPVYGAHSGEEKKFVSILNDYLDRDSDGYIFGYITDPNTILFEIKFNDPILSIVVENEFLFFSQGEVAISPLRKEELDAIGATAIKVISFVTAWNKKVMSLTEKEEYNALARVSEKFKVKDLYKAYHKNFRDIQEERSSGEIEK